MTDPLLLPSDSFLPPRTPRPPPIHFRPHHFSPRLSNPKFPVSLPFSEDRKHLRPISLAQKGELAHFPKLNSPFSGQRLSDIQELTQACHRLHPQLSLKMTDKPASDLPPLSTNRRIAIHKRGLSERFDGKGDSGEGKTGRNRDISVERPGIGGKRVERTLSLQSSPARKQEMSTSASDKALGEVTPLEPPYETPQILAYLQSNFTLLGTYPPSQPQMYSFHETINRSNNGEIYRGTHKITGKDVVIKRVLCDFEREKDKIRRIYKEISILKKVAKSDRVLRLLDAFDGEKGEIFMVFEPIFGETLYEYVKSKGKLTESEAKSVFQRILLSLCDIHKSGVIHLSLSLDSVLLTPSPPYLKLTDFSQSRLLPLSRNLRSPIPTNSAFTAPELLAQTGCESIYSDSWSLGVCLYTLLVGMVPFKGLTDKEVQKAVLKGGFWLPEGLSEEAKGAILGLLKMVPYERMTVERAIRLGWGRDSGEIDGETQGNHRVWGRITEVGLRAEDVRKGVETGECNYATATYQLLSL